MQDWHNQHGIDYVMIPAEEHGVATRQRLDEIVVAALYALNSSTYTHGRSPYQAVFGRVPRPQGDLLSDSRSLIISPNLDQQLLQPDLLRAQALSIQVTTSQGVKKAILRKTRGQQELTNLQPGQPVAYWRWSTRARQRKRGAWLGTLPRFGS